MRLGDSWPRACAGVGFVMGSWLAGCAAEGESAEGELPSEQWIVHGAASSAAQDAVVMLRIGQEGVCSGTLIAPNLVLTARHCVSRTDEGISCAPDGHAVQGGQVGPDHAPADLTVYTGRRQTTLARAAQAVRIFHDGADNLCNHDLALVLLDHDVTDIEPASLRLRDHTLAGEYVTAVGWGLTTRDQLPASRQQRRKVQILDVGPSAQTASRQLVVGESICSGDSGGPALSAAGAVIGVVSYGGNGAYDPERPSASCVGGEARNTYTRVAPFAGLVRRALKAAGYPALIES